MCFGEPFIGNLIFDQVFYILGYEPILFVCRDNERSKFLCFCSQLYKSWVIGQVTDQALTNLVCDKITICEVFEQHCRSRWLVTWDGNSFKAQSDIPEEFLPKKGAFLELPSGINLEALSSQIDPFVFRRYLLMEDGWLGFETKRRNISILQRHKNGQFVQVVIPNDRSLSDYSAAMYQAVKNVADVDGKPVEQMLITLLNYDSNSRELPYNQN